MRINEGKGYDFPEIYSTWKRYSDYEFVTVPNPFPPDLRDGNNEYVPPLDQFEVIRPAPGAAVNEFDPLTEGESGRILTELIKLNKHPGKKDILRFVKGFGVLGLVVRWNSLSTDLILDKDFGEPVWYILEQARKVSILLDLYTAASNNDFLTLKSLLTPLYTRNEEGEKSFLDFAVQGTNEFAYDVFYHNISTVTEDSYFLTAYRYIQRKLNEELAEQVDTGVALGNANNRYIFIPGVRIKTLQACVYWQLRDLVTNMKELRKCIHCGSYFIPKTERQNSCPALSFESKAPCKNRANVARHARKIKERRGNK